VKVLSSSIQQKSKKSFLVPAVFFLLLMVSLLPNSVSAEDIVITDDTGDVLRTGYVDTEVGGYDEIDIISLISTESIGDVTVVLECADDITDEVDYFYTISVSGIHISYQDGQFEVWRLGPEIQSVDNVQTGVAGKKMTAVLKKTTVGSELIMNATTQYYAMDWTKGATTESYYDMEGDFEGGAGSTVGDYSQTYMDENDDVRVIYLDERSSDEDGMDIISLSIDHGQDVELRLELDHDPILDVSMTYTVFIGKSRVIWSDGSAKFRSEDEDTVEISSSVDENIIAMTIPGEHFEDGIGGVIVRSRWDIDKNTFIQDLLPNDPNSISELLPFPTGSRREINFRIRSPGEVIMERTYSNFPSQAREDIRSSIDTDDDGSVDSSEVEAFLNGLQEEILSTDHEEDLLMNNKKGDMEISISHTGLIGQVGSGSSITIEFILEYSFTASGTGEHTYDVNIDFYQPGITGSLRYDEDTVEYLVRIDVEAGWKMDPLTLEPAELSNYLTLNGTSIEYEMTGDEAREFDPGSISFGVRNSGQVMDDDDTGDEDDLTWLYILILIVMLVIVTGIVLWYRREE